MRRNPLFVVLSALFLAILLLGVGITLPKPSPVANACLSGPIKASLLPLVTAPKKVVTAPVVHVVVKPKVVVAKANPAAGRQPHPAAHPGSDPGSD